MRILTNTDSKPCKGARNRMNTDRKLLFGVFALQAGLIDTAQVVDACTLWASRKDSTLADLLIERGWIMPADRSHLDYAEWEVTCANRAH